MSPINSIQKNTSREEANFESYLTGLEKHDKKDLMATTALSTGTIQDALLRAQNGFINCGLIDKEGNPDLSMTSTEKIELFEEANDNVNWVSKFLDAYQKDLISVEGAESALSQSTDAITNTLATLHGHLSSIPDLSAYVGSDDQFTIGVLSCTTAVMAGIAIAQLPEAKKQMLESYEGAKTTFKKLLDGETKDLIATEVADLQLDVLEDVNKFARTPRDCDPMDALISGMKCAIVASYYHTSLYKDQLTEKASSLYEGVTDFFDKTLGTNKELGAPEDRQISDELSELHELYGSLDSNMQSDEQAQSSNETQLEPIFSDVDGQDYIDALISKENNQDDSLERENESLQEKQKENGLEL